MIVLRNKAFSFFGFGKPDYNKLYSSLPTKDFQSLKKFEKPSKDYPKGLIKLLDAANVEAENEINPDLLKQGKNVIPVFTVFPGTFNYTVWYDTKDKSWVARDSSQPWGWLGTKNFQKIKKLVINRLGIFNDIPNELIQTINKL